MLVDGSWLRVPDDQVIYRTLHGDSGETRGGHWCGWVDNSEDGSGDIVMVTYCAIVPPNLTYAPIDLLPR